MKRRILILALLATIPFHANSQNFSSLSGTIRLGGLGWVWGTVAGAYMGSACLIQQGFMLEKPTVSNWLHENHNVFRFFNLGYDVVVPMWSIISSNEVIELQRPVSFQDNTAHGNDHYMSYVGYYFNWRSPFSRFGFYCGMDYEWRRFDLVHTIDEPYNYQHWRANNNIQSLVPAAGVRIRLIDPSKEIEGFPINIVLEAGVSYAAVIKYENNKGYGKDAVNNGFRAVAGLSITTNKYGSLHLRWTKDLYNLYNNNYNATEGFLLNNEIKNNFSYFSIGWATFL